jgi:hypothetical protein
MRRFAALLALVALAAGVLAATAGARVESRFSVIAHATHRARVGNHQLEKGRLLVPGDRDDIVGHYLAKFSRRGRIHAVAIFPDGKIKIQGNTNANRIPIIGGSGRWNGAAGKLKTRGLSRRDTLLTFIVVQ